MKFYLSLILIIVSFTCYGNENALNLVNKIDSLELLIKDRLYEVNSLRDSLNVVYNKLSDYESFKGEYRGSKESFKALFTVVGIIFILFGLLSSIISYFSSNRAFTSNFGSYCKKIELKEKEANIWLEKTKNHYATVLKYSDDTNSRISQINQFKDDTSSNK